MVIYCKGNRLTFASREEAYCFFAKGIGSVDNEMKASYEKAINKLLDGAKRIRV